MLREGIMALLFKSDIDRGDSWRRALLDLEAVKGDVVRM